MTRVGMFLFCLFFSPSLAFGQATSTLTGTVRDSSGAVVPTTAITVRNINTGNERSVVSGQAGDYTVPFLAPGDYALIVTKEGFRQVRLDGIRLEVNQTARVDLTLDLGAVRETVEVVGAAPLIDSDTSSIGQVIETKAIEDLPLNGRNFAELAKLTPGDELKFVLADRRDFDWALEFVRARDLDRANVVTFSPVWEGLPGPDLAEWIRDSGRNIRLGLQLHKILWGDVPGR